MLEIAFPSESIRCSLTIALTVLESYSMNLESFYHNFINISKYTITLGVTENSLKF